MWRIVIQFFKFYRLLNLLQSSRRLFLACGESTFFMKVIECRKGKGLETASNLCLFFHVHESYVFPLLSFSLTLSTVALSLQSEWNLREIDRVSWYLKKKNQSHVQRGYLRHEVSEPTELCPLFSWFFSRASCRLLDPRYSNLLRRCCL